MRPAAALLALSLAPSIARADPPPPRMLWAWERPEDLRGLARDTGVAFLRATVDVRPAGVRVAPRRQPLRVDAGTYRLAVVRVEVRPRGLSLSEAARERILAVMLDAARAPGVRGVQVDFDATASQRGAYGALLAAARRALGAGAWLSMTALASWCEGDAWIAAAAPPVDEVVPMVFTMGSGGDAVLRALRSRGAFRDPRCRASVGWAVGEPSLPLRGATRRYWFNREPWTGAALRGVGAR